MSIFNKSTLLLNMTYEPLGVISIERAIRLQIKDRVHIEEVSDNIVRSVNHELKMPSVVRLKTFVNVLENKKRNPAKKRRKIYIRDRFKCSYCLKKCSESELTLDHVIPKSQGGADTFDNVVTACVTCNQRKGNRTPQEAGMPLIHSLTKLKVGLDRHALLYHAEFNPNWKPYLFLQN